MAEDFMTMYKQALERLSTGGMSLEASLQEIEEGKKQAIGRGQQTLVSGGLGGTTVMGGVPLQAEKIAATKRLGARGRTEEKYLTTLASFAAFAQRGQEAESERQAAMDRLQKQIEAQERVSEQQYRASIWASGGAGGGGVSAGGMGGAGGRISGLTGRYIPTGHSWGRDTGGGAGGGAGVSQAQQFPSLYAQDDPGEAVPQWAGGAGAIAGRVQPSTTPKPGEFGYEAWLKGAKAAEAKRTERRPFEWAGMNVAPGLYGAPTPAGTMYA